MSFKEGGGRWSQLVQNHLLSDVLVFGANQGLDFSSTKSPRVSNKAGMIKRVGMDRCRAVELTLPTAGCRFFSTTSSWEWLSSSIPRHLAMKRKYVIAYLSLPRA